MWFKQSHTFLLLKTIIMSQKTITIIALLVSIGISFIGYLISLVAFPLAASLIDWSPHYLTLCFGIPSFLLIWICTFIITKKKALRAAVLLPLLVSIVGSIGTSGGRFSDYEYNYGYLRAYSNLYNSMGFKIIDGEYGSSYHLATSPYGEVIVGFHHEKARDDSGDIYYDEDDDEYLWEGTAKIYRLDGGYIEQKTVSEWIKDDYSYKKRDILLEEFEDRHDIDCYAQI